MNDPIVDEIHRIREEHAARFGYDLWAIVRDIKEQEERSGLKFVSFADEPSEKPAQVASKTFEEAAASVVQRNAELYERLK